MPSLVSLTATRTMRDVDGDGRLSPYLTAYCTVCKTRTRLYSVLVSAAAAAASCSLSASLWNGVDAQRINSERMAPPVASISLAMNGASLRDERTERRLAWTSSPVAQKQQQRPPPSSQPRSSRQRFASARGKCYSQIHCRHFQPYGDNNNNNNALSGKPATSGE